MAGVPQIDFAPLASGLARGLGGDSSVMVQMQQLEDLRAQAQMRDQIRKAQMGWQFDPNDPIGSTNAGVASGAFTPQQAFGQFNEYTVSPLEQAQMDRFRQTEVGKLNWALQQGYITPEQHAAAVEKATTSTPMVQIDQKGESKYAQDRGAYDAKVYGQIQDEARNASGTVNRARAMERMMQTPGFRSGAGAQFGASVSNIMRAMGLEDDPPASIEAFGAMANKFVLDQLGGSLGTGVSQADLEFIINAAPGLSKSVEGNRLLITMMRKAAERKVVMGRMAREYERRHGRLDSGFWDNVEKMQSENRIVDPEIQEQMADINIRSGQPVSIDYQPVEGEEVPAHVKRIYEKMPHGHVYILADGQLRRKGITQ